MRIHYAQGCSPESATAVNEVIRRYDFNIGSHIKDLRTGKKAARLAQLFSGRAETPQVVQVD